MELIIAELVELFDIILELVEAIEEDEFTVIGADELDAAMDELLLVLVGGAVEAVEEVVLLDFDDEPSAA